MKDQKQILMLRVACSLFTKWAYSEALLGKNDLPIKRKLNVKTILTTVLMMCLVTSLVNSQTIKVTGGVNLMSLDMAFESSTDNPIDNPDDTTDLPARMASIHSETVNSRLLSASTEGTSNETGFYLGLALSDIKLFNKFGLQPEVRFVGVKDLNQIQVPVLLRYDISEKFHASAGPNLAFLLDVGDGVKSFNFALDFGLSYDISDKIALDARYDWGQTNLLEGGDRNNYIKINNIQLGLAYHFGK